MQCGAPPMEPPKSKSPEVTKKHKSKKDKKKNKKKQDEQQAASPPTAPNETVNPGVIKLIEGMAVSLEKMESDQEKDHIFARAFLSHYDRYLNAGQLYDCIETPTRLYIDACLASSAPSAIVAAQRQTPSSIVGLLRLLCLWVRSSGVHDLLLSTDRLARVKSLLLDLTLSPAHRLTRAVCTFGREVVECANNVKLALISEAGRSKELKRTRIAQRKLFPIPSTSSSSYLSSEATTLSATVAKPLPLSPAAVIALQRSTSGVRHTPRDASTASKKLLVNDPKVIAAQLTFIDFQAFASIPVADFLHTQNPAIKQFVERSNCISYWVASNILAQPTLAAQSFAVQLFVQVAHWCEMMGNFNACFSILIGFGVWSVNRLIGIWKIQTKYKVMYAWLRERFSETKNFAAYRETLKKRMEISPTTPCIPYLAVSFKDLTFIADGNPDWTPEKLPNVTKIALVGKVLSIVCELQRRPYTTIVPMPDTALWVHVVNLYGRSEEYLEARSLAVRPKTEATVSSSDLASTESSDSEQFAIDEKELVDVNSSTHTSAAGSDEVGDA